MHVQLAHPFPKFSNVHFVCPQHARKELMRALSMRVRNWCAVPWAYTSGTDECMEHSSPKLVCALSAVPSKHSEHTRQKLMCALSVRIRNWCVTCTYTSVSNSYSLHKSKTPNLERSLQNMLSLLLRNWYVHKCARQEMMHALSEHPGAHAHAHAHQKLYDA